MQRLKALHLFRGWPDLELEFLSQYMEERVYQANDVVYYANSDVEAVFFVFAGTVALVEPATRYWHMPCAIFLHTLYSLLLYHTVPYPRAAIAHATALRLSAHLASLAPPR